MAHDVVFCEIDNKHIMFDNCESNCCKDCSKWKNHKQKDSDKNE